MPIKQEMELRHEKREVRFIHPALQANCGATQATYLLEYWAEERRENRYGH